MIFSYANHLKRRNTMAAEDLGEVRTWPEVFRKARDFYRDGKIDTFASISRSEFHGGQYWGQFLDERSGLPYVGEEALNVLAGVCPLLYTGNERFRLFRRMMSTNTGDVAMLVVVYLKQNEQL